MHLLMEAAEQLLWIRRTAGGFQDRLQFSYIPSRQKSPTHEMHNLYTHNPDTPLSNEDLQFLTGTEWLVTNGLGGYASGTVGGTLTRVFHGYLIAALRAP